MVLAVNEAVTNTLLHGYRNRPARWPSAPRLTATTSWCACSIKPLFNPTAVPPPDINLPLEERPLGGLSMHVIRAN